MILGTHELHNGILNTKFQEQILAHDLTQFN